ncbi:MAG: GAF domain-containing sensor histidine kinase [Anaerolineales bacterium]|nr:GAF domain-containing sensor histidine kinase [Anaerolineales bacterium]
MTRKTKKELENQIGSLYQASKDLVQDLSLETVLWRIVRLAQAQIEAEYAALAIRDEDGKVVNFIHTGMSEEEISLMPHPPKGKGLLGELQNKHEVIRIPEIIKDSRYSGFPQYHPEMTSMLGVPIISGEKILGQIYLTNKIDDSEFTGDDERLMKTLAAYAAVAITNTQLYNHILDRDKTLNQQYEDLSLINDLAQGIAGSWDIKEIMSRTLKYVLQYLDIETGEIFLMDRGGRDLRLSLLRGDDFEAFYTKSVFRIGDGVVGKAVGLNKPLVVYHLDSDPRILRPAIAKAGFTCQAVIPLQATREVVGVMTLSSKKDRDYSVRELDLLTTIGMWAGTAIQNALLQQQTKHLAVLEERERIGMDLHDGIIQSLYSIGLTLDYVKAIIEEDQSESLEKLDFATDGINSTITDIRAYISDLRPRQLQENKTFSENLDLLLKELESNAKISGSLKNEIKTPLNTNYQSMVALFRIAQESLSNTARHSKATKTDLRLWEENGNVYLQIVDDGVGFNIDKTEANLGHGLANMQRRSQKAGGGIQIDSAPEKGTKVLAWVPKEDGKQSGE